MELYQGKCVKGAGVCLLYGGLLCQVLGVIESNTVVEDNIIHLK